jgi:hypothetical protein
MPGGALLALLLLPLLLSAGMLLLEDAQTHTRDAVVGKDPHSY